MDFTTILNILQILLYVVLGGLALWFKQSDVLKGKAAELINTAENMYSDVTKAGGQKFDWVVNALYGLMPKAIQGIIPKTMIESIVQNTFDQMKEFAKQTLDKEIEKFTD